MDTVQLLALAHVMATGLEPTVTYVQRGGKPWTATPPSARADAITVWLYLRMLSYIYLISIALSLSKYRYIYTLDVLVLYREISVDQAQVVVVWNSSFSSLFCHSGICNAPGECECRSHWVGDTCSMCALGWSGTDCNTAICLANCTRGTCYNAPGTCTCDPQFSGTLCDSCIAGYGGANCTNGLINFIMLLARLNTLHSYLLKHV